MQANDGRRYDQVDRLAFYVLIARFWLHAAVEVVRVISQAGQTA
jgi:hypothetical protein